MIYNNNQTKKISNQKQTLSEIYKERMDREQKITNPINNSFSKEILENIVSVISSNNKSHIYNR